MNFGDSNWLLVIVWIAMKFVFSVINFIKIIVDVLNILIDLNVV